MVGYSVLKIEVDFNFLRGVLAAFSGAFVDKDFLYKLVEHGVCQRVKILILINQGYKFLCGFLALLIAGNSLFQLRNFNLKCVLLFGILCIKRPISCIRQLAEGIVLIDFANQFFQFSGSLLSSSQTPALFDISALC